MCSIYLRDLNNLPFGLGSGKFYIIIYPVVHSSPNNIAPPALPQSSEPIQSPAHISWQKDPYRSHNSHNTTHDDKNPIEYRFRALELSVEKLEVERKREDDADAKSHCGT